MLHFHLTLGESEMVSLGGIIVQLNQVRSDFALVELSKKLGIHFRFIIGDFFFLKKSCGLVTQFEFNSFSFEYCGIRDGHWNPRIWVWIL